MARVRALREEDLPRLTSLYERVFGRAVPGPTDYLKQIFFEPPWRDEHLPSLACEAENGDLVGCLGVMPRLMTLGGKTLRVAVGHHFMVEPSSRSMLAGIELARHFFQGPQDLALAEGNEFSRRIWTFFGGSVSLLYSLCWTRALRPARYALTFLERRGLSSWAAVPLKPLCRAIDATIHWVPPRVFQFPTPVTRADELDTDTMLTCLRTFARDRSLRPVYDVQSLTWLMRRLDEKHHRGRLHKMAIRTESGAVLGWYLYFLGPTGIAEVLQAGGREETIREVFVHLFYHAWQQGAISVTGAMDPGLCRALSESHCVFHRPINCWMLVHSRDPRILNAIHAGDAFLTRLEGEWWIAA